MKYLKALFQDINISQSIYEELARAKRAGYPYLDDIFTKVEILLLSEDEFKDFRNLLESHNDLHEGECQLISLCKSRDAILEIHSETSQYKEYQEKVWAVFRKRNSKC